jgi:hypothetical protein
MDPVFIEGSNDVTIVLLIAGHEDQAVLMVGHSSVLDLKETLKSNKWTLNLQSIYGNCHTCYEVRDNVIEISLFGCGRSTGT